MIYNRDNRGRFTVRKIVRKCIPYMFIIAATVYVTSYLYNPEPIHFTQIIQRAEAAKEKTLKERSDELKQEVIDTLTECESNGMTDPEKAESLIKFDPDARRLGENESLGAIQWKPATLQGFWKELKKEELSRKEAIAIALDYEKSRTFAREAIFGITGAIFHWKNCEKKEDLATHIKFIRHLDD